MSHGLTACTWFQGFSELKTSSCFIKNLFFFQVLKKPWLGSAECREESAIIWGLNEARQTVWYSVVSQCVEEQFLYDSLSASDSESLEASSRGVCTLPSCSVTCRVITVQINLQQVLLMPQQSHLQPHLLKTHFSSSWRLWMKLLNCGLTSVWSILYFIRRLAHCLSCLLIYLFLCRGQFNVWSLLTRDLETNNLFRQERLKSQVFTLMGNSFSKKPSGLALLVRVVWKLKCTLRFIGAVG